MGRLNQTKIIQRLRSKNMSLFTVFDFKKLFDIKKDNTVYKAVARLVETGILKKMGKKRYLFTLSPADDFCSANFLYPPSYVSLESALSFYGIIAQFPYQITSVTSRKTKKIAVLGKEFSYAHLGQRLFWGYEKKDAFIIALPEKALLDYLYLCSKGLRHFYKDEFNVAPISQQKLLVFSKRVANKQLQMYLQKHNLC